jgi:hypothetical protein
VDTKHKISSNKGSLKIMFFKNTVLLLLVVVFVVHVMSTSTCEAYTTRQPSNKIWTTYTPSSASSSSQSTIESKKSGGTSTGWQLSQSADASADTFGGPSKRRQSSLGVAGGPPRAAHGILSPETVARMDEMTLGGESNDAVRHFLQTYHRQGPMSCLEMLSDPDVLPHLTKAMRDII